MSTPLFSPHRQPDFNAVYGEGIGRIRLTRVITAATWMMATIEMLWNCRILKGDGRMIMVPQRCIVEGCVIGALERPLRCRVLPCPVMAGAWRCRFDLLPTHRKEEFPASLPPSDHNPLSDVLRALYSSFTARDLLGNGLDGRILVQNQSRSDDHDTEP
jgi:hypothetical protein